MDKPIYIKDIELKEGILSENHISFPEGFDNFLKEKKMILVHSKSTSNFDTGKLLYTNKIYKTQQGFYIYLSINEDGSVDTTIYYKEIQSTELTMFITQLLKQYKNATTNNNRTERKD
jgi:hypothetical protein